MSAYYNEIDPYCADWLRNLMAAGHITPGDVDERDIREVRPDDLRGFARVHLFAGIGIWDAALRGAGWPKDRPVWTASLPCQPFSGAGKREGFADERHLWPYLRDLLRECRPQQCFGEQTASGDGPAWLAVVRADLEAEGYACGATDTPAAGYGAPQIRQRLYWVAGPEPERRRGRPDGHGAGTEGATESEMQGQGSGHAGGVADAEVPERRGQERPDFDGRGTAEAGGPNPAGGVAVSTGDGPSVWDQVDWVLCRDPKGPRWRPVDRGTFPLGARHPGDVARLRAYGNSLCLPQAEAFVRAYMPEGRA